MKSPATGSAVHAPAKVNLCLHVLGRRPDGYHDLDMLVAFAAVGDRVTVSPSESCSALQVSAHAGGLHEGGDPSVVPTGIDNLAWRALALDGRRRGGQPGLCLAVEKAIPTGAGLGGGTADAAATLRALADLLGPVTPAWSTDELLGLGADLPVCLDPRPWRVGGTGGRLGPVRLPGPLPAVLVWPGRPCPTPEVFRRWGGAGGRPIPDRAVARLERDPIGALVDLRNDLTEAAIAVEPSVALALEAVAATGGCRLTRMSGSGSSVFGLYDRIAEARAAAQAVRASRPDWWVCATTIET